MHSTDLIERDLKTFWHPCSQMHDYTMLPLLIVERAFGSYIYLANGNRVIDAISSWWCKLVGHQHPRLKAAFKRQLKKFEHVISANTTNETIVKLSERLTNLTSSLKKVCYAGDGSSAVEIALKLSLHTRQAQGEFHKTKFITLQNSYHGETLGCMSVSDLGIYRHPYQSVLCQTKVLQPLPYITLLSDELWQNADQHWRQIEPLLNQCVEETTAIIVEPIVQAAAGMRIYSQDFLKRLRTWTLRNNIHLIADEVMTGLARTGKMLACEYARIEPDFLCLGKNLTAGWLPFSAVLLTDKIYDIFYKPYQPGYSFLHSHTYSGHALGASVALEVLQLIDELALPDHANALGKKMLAGMHQVANATSQLVNIRSIGAIAAADLISDENKRMGFEVYRHAMKYGALLRPLGNTIYWLPPLTTSDATLTELIEITIKAIQDAVSP